MDSITLDSLWASGTDKQYNTLNSLTYPDGSLVLKSKSAILEVAGFLNVYDFEEVLAMIKEFKNEDELLYSGNAYIEGKQKLTNEFKDHYFVSAGVVGVAKCNNCPSNEMRVELKQLRGADEPMSTIFTCVKCGKAQRRD